MNTVYRYLGQYAPRRETLARHPCAMPECAMVGIPERWPFCGYHRRRLPPGMRRELRSAQEGASSHLLAFGRAGTRSRLMRAIQRGVDTLRRMGYAEHGHVQGLQRQAGG